MKKLIFSIYPRNIIKRYARYIMVINLLAISMLHSQIMNEGVVHVTSANARATAMGDAYTAEFSDVTMMFWNPGALSFLNQTTVILDHYFELQSGLVSDVIATPVWMTDKNTVTLGWTVSHLGHISLHPLSPAKVIQSGVNLGYARLLAPGFSVGMTASAVYIDIQQVEKRWVTHWLAGLTYYPSPEISYGIVFKDVLRGAQIQQSSILIAEQLSRRLEIGISMRYPVYHGRQVVTLSLANEKIFDTKGLLYKIGLEVYPLTFVALRWGYVAGPDIAVARYGAGLRMSIVQLDYAISPSSSDVRFQQLTLSLTFR